MTEFVALKPKIHSYLTDDDVAMIKRLKEQRSVLYKECSNLMTIKIVYLRLNHTKMTAKIYT